jgi:hypothetical protein
MKQMIAADARGRFLDRSGQRWKLRLATLAVVLFVAMNVSATLFAHSINATAFGLLAAGGLGVAGGAAGCILSIECPRCGSRIAWKGMKDVPAGTWWRWLQSLDRCPTCGE